MLSVSPSAGLTTSLVSQNKRGLSMVARSLERLSTGKRINHAKDDPAGLIAAEQLRGELTDKKAQLKTSRLDQLSLRQHESRLSVVQRSLNDLRGAALESAGSLADELQRQALQQSANATIESLDRFAPRESPRGLYSLAEGGDANLIDGDATLAEQIIDDANESMLQGRAGLAADSRAINYEQQAIQDQVVITTETLSMIEDADFAEESSNLVQGQVLTQASVAALRYAQQSHIDVIGDLLERLDEEM